MFRNNKLVTALFVVLAALYILQTVLIKPDPATLARYHLSANSARALTLTIALPYIIIWFVALLGYLRLKTYQSLIKTDKDGEAWRQIANGILWLGLFLPITAVVDNQATHYINAHPSSAALITRTINYLTVVIILLAVIAVFRGSQKLLALIKAKDLVSVAGSYQLVTLLFIALSPIYVLLVLHDPSRSHPYDGVKIANYYQSDWWILITIVIPRLISWYLGIRAALNILIYRYKVKGTLYRDALKKLSTGIIGVVLSIVALRIFQTGAVRLAHLSLGTLLAVIYLLLIIISIGYIFVARGAKRLQKLEDI